MNDKIKPDYYGKLDVITFCTENNIPFCEGNIIKYVVRYSKKNGLEDLLKAREYLDRLIEKENKLVPNEYKILRSDVVDFEMAGFENISENEDSKNTHSSRRHKSSSRNTRRY